jgi:transcriptional regulator
MQPMPPCFDQDARSGELPPLTPGADALIDRSEHDERCKYPENPHDRIVGAHSTRRNLVCIRRRMDFCLLWGGSGFMLSVTDVSAAGRSQVSKPTDLVQGTLDLLILKVVALEPMHGWAIAQRIRQMSSDVLQVGQSALYPALHRLEKQGWLKSEWKTSETNRRARYYTLTAAGRRAVAQEAANWFRLSAAISKIAGAV